MAGIAKAAHAGALEAVATPRGAAGCWAGQRAAHRPDVGGANQGQGQGGRSEGGI